MILLLLLSSLGLSFLTSSLPLFLLFSLQTIAFIAYLSKIVDSHTATLYFVPNLVGSLLWLVGTLGPPCFKVSVILGLMLKLGLFPFWGWAVIVRCRLPTGSLFLFIVPLKFGTLHVLLFSVGVSLFLAFPCYLCGLYFLYLSNSVGILLFGSSLVSVCYFCLMSQSVWLFYFLAYALVLSSVCDLPYCSLSSSLSLFSLAGAAPLSLFWGKFYLLLCLQPWFACFFLLLSALPIPAYFSFLFGIIETRVSSPYFLCICVLSPPLLLRGILS